MMWHLFISTKKGNKDNFDMELIVNFATSFTNLITLNMKSDIEIARSVELKKIKQVAESIGIPRDEVENYGRYIAKSLNI